GAGKKRDCYRQSHWDSRSRLNEVSKRKSRVVLEDELLLKQNDGACKISKKSKYALGSERTLSLFSTRGEYLKSDKNLQLQPHQEHQQHPRCRIHRCRIFGI